mmetsp:Transcript_11322/g.31539  ORF Transcript_11322/g.31539 Transcript_11322/m.31539 type:complete len:258 (-) Transcript_11322:65-838(-)
MVFSAVQDAVQELFSPCFKARSILPHCDVHEFVPPCIGCCAGSRVKPAGRRLDPLRTVRSGGHLVALAISPLAGLKGVAGFHSSILVDGVEYVFGISGISTMACCASHQGDPEMKVINMGVSRYSGDEMRSFLQRFFQKGTYDLLRLNCNSFTDCALYLLCERRLDWHHRGLELLGRTADEHTGFIQSISMGKYRPNPRAASFNLETVISRIDEESHMHDCMRQHEVVLEGKDVAYRAVTDDDRRCVARPGVAQLTI